MMDFDAIKRANPLPSVIARAGIGIKKNGGEYLCLCPFHNDKNPSMTVFNGRTGWNFMCFSCGATGDTVDFVREYYGYSNAAEAGKWLDGGDTGRLAAVSPVEVQDSDPYEGYTITRPPDGTPEIIAGQRTPEILNIRRGGKMVTYTPSMVFPYRDETGGLLGYVIRQDIPARKGDKPRKLTPGVWWTVGNGYEGWAHGSYPSPRPLYGLDLLHSNPDHQVLIVEGEKCADAANRVMRAAGRRVVAVSWMGGGKAIKHTQWGAIKGRSVIIWPDAGEIGHQNIFGHSRPGMRCVDGLLDLIHDAGPRTVKVLDIPGDRPDEWDVADFEDESSIDEICDFMRRQIQEWPRDKFEAWKKTQISKGIKDAEPAYADRSPDRRDSDGGDEPAAGGMPASDAAGADSGDCAEIPGGSAFPVRRDGACRDTWRSHLVMNADGDALKSTSQQNIALMLQYEARFAGVFAWDDFSKDVCVMRRPDWDLDEYATFPRRLKETDITACTAWLEYTGLAPKNNDVGRTIVRVAEHNKFNPVRDAFDALEWDGVSRIRGYLTDDGDVVLPFLAEYFGAENTEINRLFGEKWLIGAVARALNPGCKMDTMLILEGPQGLQKSTALKVLSEGLIPGVFTDEIADPNSKDAALQMQGMWIIEIAELDAFSRASITSLKAWMTRVKDRLRRPFGKVVEEFPRSCVFAGTVNPLANSGYLKDATGGRRFWPVETTYIDIERLSADAKQIWAEALTLYKRGVKWWLTREEDKHATMAQQRRYEDDPWSETIDSFAAGMMSVTLGQLLGDQCLGIPKERQNVIVTRRITSHMVRRGWDRTDENGRVSYVRRVEE